VVAALVGGLIAVLAKGLPYNLGLILAALLGIGAGLLAENLGEQKTKEPAQ
jgi:F0F1-type ATP synthase assembly protein I